MSDPLQAILGEPDRNKLPGACAYCHETAEANVSVQLRLLRKAGPGTQKSQGVSLCPTHAAELFSNLRDQLSGPQ